MWLLPAGFGPDNCHYRHSGSRLDFRERHSGKFRMTIREVIYLCQRAIGKQVRCIVLT